LYIFGLVSVGANRKHVLRLLISLELIILGLFFTLIFKAYLALEVVSFFLVIRVCEASLGLAILVVGIFFYGSDYVQRYSVLGC